MDHMLIHLFHMDVAMSCRYIIPYDHIISYDICIIPLSYNIISSRPPKNLIPKNPLVAKRIKKKKPKNLKKMKLN